MVINMINIANQHCDRFIYLIIKILNEIVPHLVQYNKTINLRNCKKETMNTNEIMDLLKDNEKIILAM